MQEFIQTVALVVLAIVVVYFLISLAWSSFSPKCLEQLNGTARLVKDSIKACAKNCWSKHNFGSDLMSDDCFIISLYLQDSLLRGDELENEYTKSYFNVIEKNEEHKLKVRYDASRKEISLILFD